MVAPTPAPIAIQLFNDDTETVKNNAAFLPLYNYLNTESAKLYDNAYNCQALGDVIRNLSLMPLAKAIPRDAFVMGFSEIIASMNLTGTYEQYIAVLKALFGDSTDIEFTEPAPGHLQIDIGKATVELSEWVDQDGNNIITNFGDTLVFASLIDTIDSRALQQVLYSIGPNGIFVEFTISEA